MSCTSPRLPCDWLSCGLESNRKSIEDHNRPRPHCKAHVRGGSSSEVSQHQGAFLRDLGGKLPEGRDFCLLCFWLYSQCLEQCLTLGKCSISIFLKGPITSVSFTIFLWFFSSGSRRRMDVCLLEKQTANPPESKVRNLLFP